METDLKERAEQRLTAAFANASVLDSRAALRNRLRDLRVRSQDTFDRAIAHYDSHVLPALADGGDALAAWIEYGRFLGALDGPGQALAIDGAGRAVSYAPPLSPGQLALFLPDDASRSGLLLAAPLKPTPPQAAALGLLIEARLTL